MLHARAWAGLGGGTAPEGRRVCPCDGYGHWHCTRISAPYLRAFLPGGPGTLPARRREWAWAGHLPGDCARARGLYTDREHARARQYLHGAAAAVSRVSPQAKKVLSPLSSSSKLPCAIVPPDTPAPPQVSARPPRGHLSCGHQIGRINGIEPARAVFTIRDDGCLYILATRGKKPPLPPWQDFWSCWHRICAYVITDYYASLYCGSRELLSTEGCLWPLLSSG